MMYDVITGLLKPSLAVESVSRTAAEEPNIYKKRRKIKRKERQRKGSEKGKKKKNRGCSSGLFHERVGGIRNRNRIPTDRLSRNRIPTNRWVQWDSSHSSAANALRSGSRHH